MSSAPSSIPSSLCCSSSSSSSSSMQVRAITIRKSPQNHLPQRHWGKPLRLQPTQIPLSLFHLSRRYGNSGEIQSKRLCVSKCPTATDTFLLCSPTKNLSCKKNENPAHEVSIYDSQLEQCKILPTKPESDWSACPRTRKWKTSCWLAAKLRRSMSFWAFTIPSGDPFGFRSSSHSPCCCSPISSHMSQCRGRSSSEAWSQLSSESLFSRNSSTIQTCRRLLVHQAAADDILRGIRSVQLLDYLQHLAKRVYLHLCPPHSRCCHDLVR